MRAPILPTVLIIMGVPLLGERRPATPTSGSAPAPKRRARMQLRDRQIDQRLKQNRERKQADRHGKQS